MLVRDINPGPADSRPEEFACLGSKVVFSAFTEESGRELWCSDGTENGTTLIQDIRSGPVGSAPTRSPYTTATSILLLMTMNRTLHSGEPTAAVRRQFRSILYYRIPSIKVLRHCLNYSMTSISTRTTSPISTRFGGIEAANNMLQKLASPVSIRDPREAL